MDTRDGTIYETRELAKAAGVPDENLISGTREALEDVQRRLKLSKKKGGPWGRIPRADEAPPQN